MLYQLSYMGRHSHPYVIYTHTSSYFPLDTLPHQPTHPPQKPHRGETHTVSHITRVTMPSIHSSDPSILLGDLSVMMMMMVSGCVCMCVFFWWDNNEGDGENVFISITMMVKGMEELIKMMIKSGGRG